MVPLWSQVGAAPFNLTRRSIRPGLLGGRFGGETINPVGPKDRPRPRLPRPIAHCNNKTLSNSSNVLGVNPMV